MGISIWQLVIVLVIVVLLFGTKKLKNIGSDIGGAIKSFRSAVKEPGDEDKPPETAGQIEQDPPGRVIDGEVTSKERDRA